MTFYVEFLNRDFTERSKYPWKKVTVDRYSKAAIGGPKIATLTVEGSENDLWELAEMMRVPIIINDTKISKPVWWGYIESATLHINGVRRKISIRNMANRVAVAYTSNKGRETTTFGANADSVTAYGKKEVMMSATDLTSTEADNFRDTVLDQRKYPTMSVPLASSGGRNFAQIKCRGWWESLAWQYYNNLAGKEEYTDLDNFMGFEMARTGDVRPRCAQSFTNSSGANWDATKIYVRVRKEEGGIGLTDAFIAHLYSDDTGPDSSLASGSVAATDINAYMDWEEFVLDSPVTLVNGTTYWIVVQNAGYPSKDADDYYVVDGNSSEGYINGTFLVYNDNESDWEAWPSPMDMNFRVVGEEETTTQITSIVTDAGEFLLATDVIDTSGISTNPYRDGDNTAQFEIVQLLEKGTTNKIRLLARVLANYHLEVYEEPAEYEKDYHLGIMIKDSKGNEVQPTECPVGVWMQYEDVIPSSVNTKRLSNAESIFVDEAEYSGRNGSYKILKTRDVSDFKALFGVMDG